jgi:hypothetical protein
MFVKAGIDLWSMIYDGNSKNIYPAYWATLMLTVEESY